jgi:hypothetical protein
MYEYRYTENCTDVSEQGSNGTERVAGRFAHPLAAPPGLITAGFGTRPIIVNLLAIALSRTAIFML